VRRPVGRLRQDSEALREELASVREELGSLRQQVTTLRGGQLSADLFFERMGSSRGRTFTEPELDKLVKQIAATSGQDAKLARRNAAAAFRTVMAVEALGVGRLAGSNSNICGKLATVPLLAPPNADVLEIGTLYGMFAAAMIRMLHRSGIEPNFTIVDPLADIQLQPGAKMGAEPTGTPVRLDVVRANLAFGGPAGGRTRVVAGLSGDPEIRKEAGDREYGVIIVDGDHSAEGVAADLEWAETIAAPGGIVVLDDYGDPGWLGVQAAADAHLARGDSRFDLLGRVSTSAFLRARA
jgi:predicted O-methyltransferase YrrM